MKKIIAGLMIAGTAALGAFSHVALADGELKTWQASTQTDSRLYEQMSRFSSDGNPLKGAFEAAFTDNIKYDVFWRANNQVDQFRSGHCTPATNVGFLDSDSLHYPAKWQLSAVEKDFEDGFVRVESVACLKHGDAAKAMRIFLDNDFRLKSLAQLSSSKYEGGLLCEGTSKVPLVTSATSQCMALQRLEGAGIQSVYGMIVGNTSGFQPVYFRQNLVTFVDMPDGSVAAHLVIYGRADTIASILHGPARSKLRSAQQDAFAELDRRLGL